MGRLFLCRDPRIEDCTVLALHFSDYRCDRAVDRNEGIVVDDSTVAALPDLAVPLHVSSVEGVVQDVADRLLVPFSALLGGDHSVIQGFRDEFHRVILAIHVVDRSDSEHLVVDDLEALFTRVLSSN